MQRFSRVLAIAGSAMLARLDAWPLLYHVRIALAPVAPVPGIVAIQR